MVSAAVATAVRVRPTPARGGGARVPNAVDIAKALIPETRRLVGPSVARITQEMVVPVTSERADIAVIGNAMWLFEIKSGRDSLKRLRRQADAFARIADRCVLVAASRHLTSADAALPSWWGIIEVPDGSAVTLRWQRLAAPNPGTDRRTLLLMLRRDEAAAALMALDGRSRSGRRRMSLLAELDRCLDDDAVGTCVRDALIHRPQQPGRSAVDQLIDA
jgi:hypothetical protein